MAVGEAQRAQEDVHLLFTAVELAVGLLGIAETLDVVIDMLLFPYARARPVRVTPSRASTCSNWMPFT